MLQQTLIDIILNMLHLCYVCSTVTTDLTHQTNPCSVVSSSLTSTPQLVVSVHISP